MKKSVAWLVLLGTASVWAGAGYVDLDLNMVFPDKLGGLEYQRMEKYSNETLGYSVFYAKDPGLSAEVTVFTLGKENIGTGHEAPGIAAVFDETKKMLDKRDARGEIAQLKLRGKSIVPDSGKIRFASVVYQFDDISGGEPQKKLIATYATAARGNFIKLDFTFDIAKSGEAKAASEQMVKQLIEAFSSKPTEEDIILAACTAVIANPMSYGGSRSAQKVVEYAKTLDLGVYEELFVWPDGWQKPKNTEMLIAAYFAGMLKVVIPEGAEAGGDFEAFVAMLNAYEVMLKNGDIKNIAEFDEWLKAEDQAALYEQLLIKYEYKSAE